MRDILNESIRSGQNQQKWKYSLKKLVDLVEIKRMLINTKKESFVGQTALVIDQSQINDYGIIEQGNYERIGDRRLYLAKEGQLCVQGKNIQNSVICPEKFCLMGRNFFVIEGEKEILAYILILMKSGYLDSQAQILASATGKILGVKGAQQLHIPVPPLEIQKKIIAMWDKKAAQVNVFLNLLKQLENTVSEFEKVCYREKEDKASNQDIKTGVINENELFDQWSPQNFLLSGQMDCSNKKLKDLVQINSGVRIHRWENSGLPVYGSGNVIRGYLSSPPLGYVYSSNTDIRYTAVLNNNDIMLCVLGNKTLGKAALFQGDIAVINQSLARVRVKANHEAKNLDTRYLTLIFNTHTFHQNMVSMARGTKSKYVNIPDVLEIKVPEYFAAAAQYIEKYFKLVESITLLQNEMEDAKTVAKRCIEKYLLS